jgi:hypothetical protein
MDAAISDSQWALLSDGNPVLEPLRRHLRAHSSERKPLGIVLQTSVDDTKQRDVADKYIDEVTRFGASIST